MGKEAKLTTPPPLSDSPPPATSSVQPVDGRTGATPAGKKNVDEKREKAALRPYDVLANYQILKRLGMGGMADVYLARAMLGSGVDKLVAVKTVLPEFGPDTKFGAMFLREARVSATLHHPNLIQVFDFGEAMGRPYLSMEYVHGRELTALLRFMKKRMQVLSPDIAVGVTLELCKALEYVHTRKDLDGRPLNLVHRDVSPGNVLLSAASELKLMDFGVAAGEGGKVYEGLLVGKVPYMTVDQASGETPRPLWDLFAVGVMLYELLTLHRPYPNVPLNQFAASREKVNFPRPSSMNPTVPPALDELVMRAATETTAFESATEFRKQLEEIQAHVGPADLGGWVRVIFGEELQKEQAEVEQLTLEARRRSGFKDDAGASNPVSRQLLKLRRKVASSRAWMAASQRPWLLRSIGAAVVIAVLGSASLGLLSMRHEREFVHHLEAADAQAQAGRLVGPTGTEMLGELLLAKKLKPDDARVNSRLKLLADKFQTLGDAALSRTNREEAAAHYEAALKADPSREPVKQKLKEIEDEILKESRARVVLKP